MYTFGYSFKTWDDAKSFADAPSILKYLNEASKEYNVIDKITYNQRAISYAFDSKENLWHITSVNTKTNQKHTYAANFIFNCSGYYSYEKGYTPDYNGLDDYEGTFVHPQKWPSTLELKNKDVLTELMNDLGKAMPVLKEVLIDERDSYLAKKIKESDGKKVVAVVGAGHLEGIIKKIYESLA